MNMKLYDYFRSTASYRVRIALNYKGIEYHQHVVHLAKDGGEQFTPEYKTLNPQCLVPTIVDGDQVLTQSIAILEYLEEIYPEPALLPDSPLEKARVRSLVQIVASDIHPLNNLRVLKFLKQHIHVTDEQKLAWYHHWLKTGFDAIETLLARSPETGLFCHGDAITFADICLIPQVYNAHRFEFDMEDYPTINRVNEDCLRLPYFEMATPEVQTKG